MNNKRNTGFYEVSSCLPEKIKKELLNMYEEEKNAISEIRLRINRPVELVYINKRSAFFHKDEMISKEQMEEMIENICQSSLYSYIEQLKNGFITINGGHRVGICGSGVGNGQVISAISDISSLIFRISRQVKGFADSIINKLTDGSAVRSTLVISPPAYGKTTLLCDIARQLSDGFKGFGGCRVCLADERGEISGISGGIPQRDVGFRTDVMDGVKKNIALEMLVRSMSPDVIIADEIGSEDDGESITFGALCGVGLICSTHGSSFEEIHKKPVIQKLLELKIFSRIVVIRQPCMVSSDDVYDAEGNHV